MGTDTIVGTYGDMPIDMLLRKNEVTCSYMNPSLVDDYHRSTLKNMRPDERFFESDQPRGGTDTTGKPMGNNISERFLSFRNSGFQSEQSAEPYLPDGTFLDHQFLEADPRGVALGPDMRKHAAQQFSRASLINFKNDADPSVPSAGIDPWTMNTNVRSIQNITKDYYKNFDTAWDAWGVSGSKAPSSDSRMKYVANSCDMRDPKQIPNRNMMNVTNSLSNDTSIGFRRTTDHVFKVAKYGKTNKGATFTDENWYKNRANVHIDHDVMVSWQDSNVSKNAALKMVDLSKQKIDAHLTGLNGIHWDESKHSRSTKHKLTPVDMSGMAKRPVSESQPKSAHEDINGESAPNSGARLIKTYKPVINKTHINTTIYEQMGLINRKNTKQQKDDLRNEIQRTATDPHMFTSEKNKKRKLGSKDTSKLLWESVADYDKGTSKNIMNYKAAAKYIKGHNLQKLNKTEFKNDSKYSNQRRGRIDKSANSKMGEGEIDNDFGRDDVITKTIGGGMGNKYMRPHMDRDGYRNDLNDH
jgi:hypothetical protein